MFLQRADNTEHEPVTFALFLLFVAVFPTKTGIVAIFTCSKIFTSHNIITSLARLDKSATVEHA